jgi:hypothetical protein
MPHQSPSHTVVRLLYPGNLTTSAAGTRFSSPVTDKIGIYSKILKKIDIFFLIMLYSIENSFDT